MLFDVSKSMLAQDVGGSRLERAKGILLDLLDSLEGYEASLLVFAEKPQTLVPRTTDIAALSALSERITSDSLPAGSNLEEALKAGARRVGDGGTLILFSDGEELQGKARSTIGMLRSRKIAVYTLGFGTPEGATIPEVDPWGNMSVHAFKGEPVTSRLNHDLLAQMAEETRGHYYENPLRNPMRFRALTDPKESPIVSLAWIPGILALLCLVAAHLKRLLLVGLVLMLGAWTPFGFYHYQKGTEAFQRQQWQKASQEFAALKNPQGDYNRGCALYRQKQYAKAKQAFEASLQGKVNEGGIRYNLGNTLYRMGKPYWKQAIKEYKRAIALNPKDEDARYNLKVIEDKLKPPSSKPDKSESDAALGMLEQSERQLQAQRKAPSKDSMDTSLENLWKPPQPDW
jgi:Ca-activated chloride channel family protein